ncbi:glycerol-3-phosphate dehydrogenase [Kordiimonas sp. SCSIO 12610]|uniref:glycerol-3-phosphate dehydrogenase n=1 Tax=Kordiimonas sp. SCSIO 12610 TaxID=2829597 RepID=UPI00210CA64D|nr:glycerol-3-phosphate dehydrogenase [Kordiimonas sp. SCSIO 12610]UTW54779.1 glycerol-3-phosphate dehydrogenase [Kordiimonas sp. SCSIO 12610]
MYDLLIIGGGINGAGIARDAAGRGLKVLLVEKDDLASHTSSASTKLIHGGLRYLEYYDFALVRKALKEREVLLRAAPHIIWPLRFVLPYHSGLRPAWLIRLGLFIYDHIGGRKLLPATKTLKRSKHDKLNPLTDNFSLAFEYSDCWVDDARLVVLNAVDAANHGADILTQTECINLTRSNDFWTADLLTKDGANYQITSKAIINAAGPWVETLASRADKTLGDKAKVRLVKGSHIIINKHFDGDHAFFFQNADGRIIFAIPYENNNFTLIGTTDLSYDGDKDDVQISDEEIQYLCASANEYFKNKIDPNDVVATYSGVRPLYDDKAADASAVTRDYILSYDNDGGAPILSIFGGKITTYRKLAEDSLALFQDALLNIQKREWTNGTPLPGGDIENADFDGFFKTLLEQYNWLDTTVLRRLARCYGTQIHNILQDVEGVNDLGAHYGFGLYHKEVEYLQTHEFAKSVDDILFRRTKLGLYFTDDQKNALELALSDLLHD